MNDTAAPTPDLQERKQQLVRTAIWEAATDLFAENGYDETTVDQIAERAGISRRSFFRYFASKNDLMAFGTTAYADVLVEAIRSAPPQISAAELFRQVILEVVQQAALQPNARKVMQIATRYPAAAQALHSRSGELRARMDAEFATRASEISPSLTTGLMLATLDVVFRAWFEHPDENIADTAVRVLETLSVLVHP